MTSVTLNHMQGRIGYAAIMKHEALVAWTSLYIAVGAMALICAALAVMVTAHDWQSRRWRPALDSAWDAALFLPKIWLRWQLNYLKGAPVIAAVALYYASDVGFYTFWDL